MSKDQYMHDTSLSRKMLLNNLHHNTYCRLAPSKLSGVGVIAIKNIDANIDPFQTVYKLDITSIDLTEKEVESLDPGVKALIKDFFMKTEEGTYPVYFNGLNAMDIAYYLNHSDNPNVAMVQKAANEDSNLGNSLREQVNSSKDLEYFTFRTIKRVAESEELTIDYYQHTRSLKEIMKVREQFKLPFPSYALRPKAP